MPDVYAPTSGRASLVEPFASDTAFATALAAYADAVVLLAVAIAVSIALALAVGGLWAVLPFVLPLPLLTRGSHAAATSSRLTRTAFADQRSWRDAERHAVAVGLPRAVVRRRW